MRGQVPQSLTGRSGSSSSESDERGVSPVVAVALLLGVTVVLGVTIGPFVFGTLDTLGSATPEAQFGFFYQGELDDISADDFGTSTDAGDGIVVITMESDERLDPANVEVRTPASGGNLLNDTDDDVYADGDFVRQGDEISVVADRGDTVQVIWNDPSKDDSGILGEVTIPAAGPDVPPGVPTPNLGCDWVNDVTDAGGDFVVQQGQEFEAGDVVACDSFDDTVDGEVDIEGDLTVIASINTPGQVTISDGSFSSVGDVYGAIDTASSLTLDDLTVTGSITADGTTSLDGVDVESDLTTSDTTDVVDATVDGDVVVEGNLTLDNSTVTGGAEVSGTLTCENGSTIADEDCGVYKQAKYHISITGTSWPGVENETFRVEAVIENIRIEQATRAVRLDAAGSTHDERSITLDGDEQTLAVFEWEVSDGDAGEHIVTVETNESDRDELDSKTVEVRENRSGLPTVETFDTSTGGDGSNSIAVDWNVTAGDANLSAVTVELLDSTGNEAGSETWYLSGDQADNSKEFTDLADQNHSVKLDVSDQGNEFVSEIVPEQPAG